MARLRRLAITRRAVPTRGWERLEPGDLVGLAVHPGLAQDAAGRVVHHRQQVQLRRVVVAAAAHGLAVDGDRPMWRAARRRRARWWVLAGRVAGPLTDRGQGPGAGQHHGDRHRQDRAQRVGFDTT